MCLVVIAVAACHRKAVDPAYKAALETRMNAYCGCRDVKEPDAIVTCYEAAEREHPEPAVPGGMGAGTYQESLRDGDAALVHKLEYSTIACDTELFHWVQDYKTRTEAAAKQAAADADQKALVERIDGSNRRKR